MNRCFTVQPCSTDVHTVPLSSVSDPLDPLPLGFPDPLKFFTDPDPDFSFYYGFNKLKVTKSYVRIMLLFDHQ
jgi:hypothetical protein